MLKSAAILTTLLLLAASATAGELPEGAVASVRGRVLTHEDLMTEVVRRLGKSEGAQARLKLLIVTHAIQAESKRRGTVLSPEELDTYIVNLEKMAGGAKALDAMLAGRKMDRAEFLELTRIGLLGQKLATADLKLQGPPDSAQEGIWRDSLLERLGTEIDPAKLPAGVAATVGDSKITIVAFGETIAREAGVGVVAERVLEPWIAVIAIKADLAKNEITVSDEEVEAQIEQSKRDFLSENAEAASMGVTYEQALEAKKGQTIADLRKDAEFKAVIGLRKLLKVRLTDEDLKTWFEKHADAFGERRQVLQILVRAGKDDTFDSGGRGVEEARRIAEDIMVRLRAGEKWEEVAKRGDDASKTPILVMKTTTAPPKVLEAILKAEAGRDTGPIKSLYGFHILRVVAILEPMTFDEARNLVQRALLKQQEQTYYRALRTDPEVKRSATYK
jgi:PPIC-type PPIASE domain